MFVYKTCLANDAQTLRLLINGTDITKKTTAPEKDLFFLTIIEKCSFEIIRMIDNALYREEKFCCFFFDPSKFLDHPEILRIVSYLAKRIESPNHFMFRVFCCSIEKNDTFVTKYILENHIHEISSCETNFSNEMSPEAIKIIPDNMKKMFAYPIIVNAMRSGNFSEMVSAWNKYKKRIDREVFSRIVMTAFKFPPCLKFFIDEQHDYFWDTIKTNKHLIISRNYLKQMKMLILASEKHKIDPIFFAPRSLALPNETHLFAENYVKNPKQVLMSLKREQAAEMFALTIFLCDDFLVLKN